MDGAGRAVDHKKRRIRTEKAGSALLRLLDAAFRPVQIVELLHQRNLFRQPLLRDAFPQKPMRPEPLLMPRRMESKSAGLAIGAHGLCERRSRKSGGIRRLLFPFPGGHRP